MADNEVNIEVPVRGERTITFRLGEERYEFRVPKLHGVLETMAAIAKVDQDNAEARAYGEIAEWLLGALSDDDAARIRERLADDDDGLDYVHIIEAFKELAKAASSRPSG